MLCLLRKDNHKTPKHNPKELYLVGKAQWGSIPEVIAQFKQDKVEIWYV